MGRSRTTRWSTGTAVLCVLVLVATWSLLVAPRYDAAAQHRQQAQAVQEQNVALASRLAELRQGFEQVDDLRTELAGLRVQMPDHAGLSELTRRLDDIAAAHGVTVVSMGAQGAIRLGSATAPAAADAAPAAAVGETVSADEPAVTAPVTSGAPATPVDAAGEELLAVPLTIVVVGSLDGTRAFLADLQTAMDRPVLVTTLSATALEQSPGEGGRPPSVVGDVELEVGAYAYVLRPPADSDDATTVAPEVAPPALPTAPARRNPFAPVPADDAEASPSSAVVAPAAVPTVAPTADPTSAATDTE